jgi:WD40 repeat protein
MRRFPLPVVLVIAVTVLAGPLAPSRAQQAVFPLPAPLYILTSQHAVILIDPATGGQMAISSIDQPVADFDISPDGEWYLYRTTANNAVVVSQIEGGSGYVVEFGETTLPPSSAAQTIAWAPDAAAMAYIVPEGVRIAEPGAGAYGELQLSTVQGPWIELYWVDPHTLIASDQAGQTTRISGSYEHWSVELVSGVPARPQPSVPSFLSAQGVMLGNNVAVPGTAGALAFDWGPVAPPVVASISLPADLYFLAPDAAGTPQVWRLPGNNQPAHAVTAGGTPVTGYAVATGRDRLAYAAGGALVAATLSGSDRRELAQFESTDFATRQIAWSPDGTLIAYPDSRGLWVVSADGRQSPRLVISNNLRTANAGETRVYSSPQWNPDGTRLLVVVGFYEGSLLGVVDVATGGVTELKGASASNGLWTGDGRVLAWSWSYGYQVPGLYLLDPAAPDAPAATVLGPRYPVVHVTQGPDGQWVALVSAVADVGPRFLRVWAADAPDGPFAPLYGDTGGGFVDASWQIVVPRADQGGPVLVAGLRSATADTGQGLFSGDLVVLDMQQGAVVRIQTPGRVSDVQWRLP